MRGYPVKVEEVTEIVAPEDLRVSNYKPDERASYSLPQAYCLFKTFQLV